MAVFVICLIVLNIILWVIFLIRFKKLFSTDKIIETTAEKMNKMVMEIDKTTKRDLYLSQEASKNVQLMLDEADRKMELFKEASQRLRDMIAESDRINKLPISKNPIYQKDIPEVPAKKRQQKATVKKNIDAYKQNSAERKITDDMAFEIINSQEQDLFESEEKNITSSEMQITENGAAFKEVPLIITKVYDEVPVDRKNEKKNLSKQVQELYNSGYNVQEIANELSCSITEVQLIIDMNL